MNKMFRFLLIVVVSLQGLVVFSQVVNAGVGGNNSAQLLQRIDEDVLSQSPDLVILMVGTNDMINRNKILSYEEYEKNYRQLIKRLKASGIEVLLMSSLPVDSAYVFTRHPRALFSQYSPNDKMNKVRQLVEQMAKDNDLYYLDLFKAFSDLGLPRHNQDLFIRNQKNSGAKDGVHPTALGYHFIGANVFHYLKTNNLLKADMKIICFGDSITRGQGAKGSGTVNGESYPAVLSRMLEIYDLKTRS